MQDGLRKAAPALPWLIGVAPRHKGRRQQRENRFAALVGAGVAGLRDTPFGTLLGRSQRFDFACETDGVAGQHRADPAQFAKPRRRSPDRNLLAARGRLLGLTLAVGHQKLHADRSDMPARGRQPAEQRVASRFFIEMKALRVELRREFLDQFRGEGERSQFAPQPDFEVLEETHQPACPAAASARRLTMIGVTISHSACPAALRIKPWNVTIPVSGRLRETRASVTSMSSVRSSPGRSGASQRNSLTPGDPSDAVRPIKPSNIIRIMIEPRCQPEPDRPLSNEAFAASSSRCIGCGSNSAANASISSRVTRRGPKVPKWPGLKSSKMSVMLGDSRSEARLWPLFAAISSRQRGHDSRDAARVFCPDLPAATFRVRHAGRLEHNLYSNGRGRTTDV